MGVAGHTVITLHTVKIVHDRFLSVDPVNFVVYCLNLMTCSSGFQCSACAFSAKNKKRNINPSADSYHCCAFLGFIFTLVSKIKKKAKTNWTGCTEGLATCSSRIPPSSPYPQTGCNISLTKNGKNAPSGIYLSLPFFFFVVYLTCCTGTVMTARLLKHRIHVITRN